MKRSSHLRDLVVEWREHARERLAKGDRGLDVYAWEVAADELEEALEDRRRSRARARKA